MLVVAFSSRKGTPSLVAACVVFPDYKALPAVAALTRAQVLRIAHGHGPRERLQHSFRTRGAQTLSCKRCFCCCPSDDNKRTSGKGEVGLRRGASLRWTLPEEDRVYQEAGKLEMRSSSGSLLSGVRLRINNGMVSHGGR